MHATVWLPKPSAAAGDAEAGPVGQDGRTLFRCEHNRLILIPVCLGRLPIRHHGGAVVHRPGTAGTGLAC